MALKLKHTRTEALTEILRQGRDPVTVHYKGRTTDTTKTELFIDGIENYRLQLPLGATAVIDKACLCWNLTDDAPGTNTPELAVGTVTARTAADAVSGTQTNVHTICDIEFDNTSGKKYVTVSVTGGDSTDTLEWDVALTITCFSSEESRLQALAAFDNIQK